MELSLAIWPAITGAGHIWSHGWLGFRSIKISLDPIHADNCSGLLCFTHLLCFAFILEYIKYCTFRAFEAMMGVGVYFKVLLDSPIIN